ncbi:hypothetical protein L195_g051593, partial [Trifolium pratense]
LETAESANEEWRVPQEAKEGHSVKLDANYHGRRESSRNYKYHFIGAFILTIAEYVKNIAEKDRWEKMHARDDVVFDRMISKLEILLQHYNCSPSSSHGVIPLNLRSVKDGRQTNEGSLVIKEKDLILNTNSSRE